MNIKRKIAEGVAGWLMYEYHSMRADLFDEKYLVTPISNILNGVFSNRVIAEYKHPILKTQTVGAGRPPQIDFVITKNQKIDIAIESKWYGNTPVKVSDIIWDLIRLELLHREYNATCYFVLGGKKKKLANLFESKRFQEPRENGRKRPILRIKKERKQSLRLDSPPEKRAKLILDKMKQYKEISMPSAIITGYPSFYPIDCRNSDHQVYVWEISSFKNKPRFYPRDNKNYK